MRTVKLGDICLKIGSGATPKGGKNVYTDTGTALIRSQNVHNLDFVWEGLARISDDAASKLANVTLEPNDVLLNITGDSVARVCLVPEEAAPCKSKSARGHCASRSGDTRPQVSRTVSRFALHAILHA